jgi:flavodoxin
MGKVERWNNQAVSSHVNIGVPDFNPGTVKEHMMNALVVYESQFGNTEKVAMAVAGALRAFGQAQAVPVGPEHRIELKGVDMLVVGGPTQNRGATAGIQSFLAAIPPELLRNLRVACFDTRLRQPGWLVGSAAGAMAKDLQKIGVSPLVPAESFLVSGQKGPLVSGELERAAAWAQTIGRAGTTGQEQK